jgi:hypothetical protein
MKGSKKIRRILQKVRANEGTQLKEENEEREVPFLP